MNAFAALPGPPPGGHSRRPKVSFSAAEDALLIQLVEQFGESWHEIEQALLGRTARQCRDRWNLYLSPNIRNDPWTADEDVALMRLYQVLGPKWTSIATQFPNRTPHNIKIHQRQLQRRVQRICRFTGKSTDGLLVFDPQNPPMPGVPGIEDTRDST
jgi:hypothetical protein